MTTPQTYGTITFSATVSPSAATGTVTFKDGSTTLGTGTLSGGTATFTPTASQLTVAGSPHSITAVYGGDLLCWQHFICFEPEHHGQGADGDGPFGAVEQGV